MMARYRKLPIVIEAEQWFALRGHPGNQIVRPYRRPDVSGECTCARCGIRMAEHGWIDTLEGGHTVCPGDWIIKGVAGEYYPCKPAIFAATYEPSES